MTVTCGTLTVLGLGPGSVELRAPAAQRALEQAQDIVGYAPYVRLIGALHPEQSVYASDNRMELERARQAFELAIQGRRVALISSGDPGIFAMASAVFEVLAHTNDPAWHQIALTVIPGISAAQAAAALAGAPLGHDFCVLSLSDNLKSWAVIEQRLNAVAAVDLVLALYNPISLARPWQAGRALELIRQYRDANTPVILGRDIAREAEHLRIMNLAEVQPEYLDMRTVVIIGSSMTKCLPRMNGGYWVYTPRWYSSSNNID